MAIRDESLDYPLGNTFSGLNKSSAGSKGTDLNLPGPPKGPSRMDVRLNRIFRMKDFDDPEWSRLLFESLEGPTASGFPQRDRITWECGQLLYGLSRLGALHPDSLGLCAVRRFDGLRPGISAHVQHVVTIPEGNIEGEQGEYVAPPFPDNAFDFALTHLPLPGNGDLANEIQRLTDLAGMVKPGGIVGISLEIGGRGPGSGWPLANLASSLVRPTGMTLIEEVDYTVDAETFAATPGQSETTTSLVMFLEKPSIGWLTRLKPRESSYAEPSIPSMPMNQEVRVGTDVASPAEATSAPMVVTAPRITPTGETLQILNVATSGAPDIRLLVRPTTWDSSIAGEVIGTDCYRTLHWTTERKPKFVVDVGAHIGCFSTWMGARYPETRILSFEMLPENWELLRRNTSLYPNVTAVNGAFGGEEVPIAIHPCATPENTGGGWVEFGSAKDASVDHFTLPGIIQEYGIDRIDLLKLDCEGSEFPILDHAIATGVIEKVDALTMELHLLPDLAWNRTLERAKEILSVFPHHEIESKGEFIKMAYAWR